MAFPKPILQELPLHRMEPLTDAAGVGFGKDAADQSLLQSLGKYGILVPLAVQHTGPDRYKIVDGRRRFRAAVRCGYDTVPCLVYSDLRRGDIEYLRFVL